MKRLALFFAAIMAVFWLGHGQAQAQDAYPTKPITLIVPSGTGGDADRLARALATYMAKQMGKPVVVENHPGAGNLVGHKYFLQTPQDGYTFLVTAAHPYIATNILVQNAGFTLDDFDFIDTMWEDYAGLYVNKDRPWKTLGALIDAIKANPGKISASVIYGSSGQIGILALEQALGLPDNAVKIVTYDGGGDTKTAVAGGTVDFTSNQVNGMDTIKDFVVPVGVFEKARIPDFAGPTVDETLAAYKTSVPNIKGSMRAFVSTPSFKKNYPDRYNFIVDALHKTIDRPDFKSFMASQNMGDNWIGPDQSKAEIYENYDVWKKYVYLLKK